MFQQFLDSFWSSIGSMIDMLKDSSIASYMFNGVSLWVILITFFAGWILLRFFLNSFGGGSGFWGWFSRGDRGDKDG